MCASDMRALGLVRGLLLCGGEPGDIGGREDQLRMRGVTVGGGDGVVWPRGARCDGGVTGMKGCCAVSGLRARFAAGARGAKMGVMSDVRGRLSVGLVAKPRWEAAGGARCGMTVTVADRGRLPRAKAPCW